MDYRVLNSRFWSDSFVEGLNPTHRYLFLYLILNPHVTISGVYELSVRKACFETGLSEREITSGIEHLKSRVLYVDGWVVLKNFLKHTQTRSPQLLKGIEKSLNQAPKHVLDVVKKEYGVDRVSIPHVQSMVSISSVMKGNVMNSNVMKGKVKKGKEPVAQSAPAPTPSGIARGFFDGGKEFTDIRDFLCSKLPSGIVDAELKKFVSYWTEPNKSGSKVRWEQQNTFEVKRRIATWFNNIKGHAGAGRSTGRGLA